MGSSPRSASRCSSSSRSASISSRRSLAGSRVRARSILAAWPPKPPSAPATANIWFTASLTSVSPASMPCTNPATMSRPICRITRDGECMSRNPVTAPTMPLATPETASVTVLTAPEMPSRRDCMMLAPIDDRSMSKIDLMESTVLVTTVSTRPLPTSKALSTPAQIASPMAMRASCAASQSPVSTAANSSNICPTTSAPVSKAIPRRLQSDST